MVAVIPAVLILIIVGSVWLAYKGYTHQRESGRRRPRQEMRYRCTQCRHEFGMTPREFANEAARENPDGKRPVGLANCPSCDRKACAQRLLECPQCGKHYPPEAGEPVCPHCKAEYRTGTSERPRRRDE